MGTFRPEGERTVCRFARHPCSREEVEGREKAGDFLGISYNGYEKGYGVVGEPDNDLYPGWNPKKVADFI